MSAGVRDRVSQSNYACMWCMCLYNFVSTADVKTERAKAWKWLWQKQFCSVNQNVGELRNWQITKKNDVKYVNIAVTIWTAVNNNGCPIYVVQLIHAKQKRSSSYHLNPTQYGHPAWVDLFVAQCRRRNLMCVWVLPMRETQEWGQHNKQTPIMEVWQNGVSCWWREKNKGLYSCIPDKLAHEYCCDFQGV